MAGKRIDYIYDNEADGFWFKVKAFFGQIFRGQKKNNEEHLTAVRGELDELANSQFDKTSKANRFQKTFEKFNYANFETGKNIKSIADVNRLGQALTSNSKRDRERKNSFYKLISEPLMHLSQLEENSEEYANKREELLDNIEMYLGSHKPSSKIGKARCEFAERLNFILANEKSIEENDYEDEMNEEDEEEMNNSIVQKDNEKQEDNSRERISLKILEDKKVQNVKAFEHKAVERAVVPSL